MVFKVARIMAPSVVYIDECEKVWGGGVGAAGMENGG